jgi:chemotaxis protein histidine kinase CheA
MATSNKRAVEGISAGGGAAAKKQAVGGALTHDLLTQQPPPLEASPPLATLGGAKTSAIASDPTATEPPAAPAPAAPPAAPPAPAVKVTLDKFNFVPSEHFSVMGWEIFIEDGGGGGDDDSGGGGPTFVEASSKLHGIDHFLVTEHRPEGSEKGPVKVSHNPQTIKPANISNVLLYHPIPDQLMVKAVGPTGAILTQGVVQIASTAPPKPQPTVTQLKQKREREQQSKLKTEQKAAAKKKAAEAAEATAVSSAAGTVTTSPAAAAAATAAAAAVMAAGTAVKAEGAARTSATAPPAGAAASKDAAAGEDIEHVRKQQQELERTVHQQAEELAQLKKMLQDVQAQKMLQAGGGDEKKGPAAPKL